MHATNSSVESCLPFINIVVFLKAYTPPLLSFASRRFLRFLFSFNSCLLLFCSQLMKLRGVEQPALVEAVQEAIAQVPFL